ncbi:hypothetical protein KDN32_14670 [Nocardioides sp. J2M5]|uniref:hypothetical protein n=1 Tax=Nocardioides palaemonis TaxID=2829810 RepID=UPI001BA817B4|nr:hypothetical protein [Nocardioides palaemonis]MBS2938980.1 hypothetical protein [Nocardioides palaemonis]
MMGLVAPGTARSVLALRALLVVLPFAALALALPAVPHWFVLVGVAVCSLVWAQAPDHAAGVGAIGLVAGWWSAHDVLDWRVLVVGLLLVLAHVTAVVLAHGTGALPVDPHLVGLWGRRSLLTLVPMPLAYVALRGLDSVAAPPWLWASAGLPVAVALLVTARLTQARPE